MSPSEALDLAQELHMGQLDKSGKPYWQHLQRVQARLSEFPANLQIAAALHDSIEDTDVSAEQLVEMGVPIEAVRIVTVLTKSQDVEYEAYLERIAQDQEALWIKLADVADNSDALRLAHLPKDQRDRLRKKYTLALDILLN